MEKSKKKRVFGNWFWSSFIFLSRVFPRSFSFWFWFSNSLFFSHLSYYIYPIYKILFCEKNWFVVYSDHLELFVIFVITKSCNLSFLWVSLLCRGDCGGCVGIPLSVEVIKVVVWRCAFPSRCRGGCALGLLVSL